MGTGGRGVGKERHSGMIDTRSLAGEAHRAKRTAGYKSIFKSRMINEELDSSAADKKSSSKRNGNFEIEGPQLGEGSQSRDENNSGKQRIFSGKERKKPEHNGAFVINREDRGS